MNQAIPVEQLKSLTMSIYRYDPSVDEKPYMQDIVIEVPTDKDIMVLDALHIAKDQEPSRSYSKLVSFDNF
jgi:succinate dehydrogenase / fumarate reductase iron-sulfur subunit